MKIIDWLHSRDRSSALAFHLKGVLEASDSIRHILEKIDPDADQKTYASDWSQFQVEHSHLSYHLKELRLPLRSVIRKAYESLPDIDEAESSRRAAEIIRGLDGKRAGK